MDDTKLTRLDADHVLVEPDVTVTNDEPQHALYTPHDVPAAEMAVLGALQGKPMYEGTVPHHVKARRRTRNKVARASRRANRKAAR